MRARVVGWVLVGGCVRAPPPPPPPPVVMPAPPPPISIPAGCAADLSGELLQPETPLVRWVASDDLDAGRLLLVTTLAPPPDAGVRRRFSRDGGLPWLLTRADAGETAPVTTVEPRELAHTTLLRTPTGFVGQTLRTADGGCAFVTVLAACDEGALTLETEARRGPQCSDLPDASVVRVVLRRPDAGAPQLDDAGSIAEAGDGGGEE